MLMKQMTWMAYRERVLAAAVAIEPDCPSITGRGRLTADDVMIVQDGNNWFAYIAAGQLRRPKKLVALTRARVSLVAFAGNVGQADHAAGALLHLATSLEQLAERLHLMRTSPSLGAQP